MKCDKVTSSFIHLATELHNRRNPVLSKKLHSRDVVVVVVTSSSVDISNYLKGLSLSVSRQYSEGAEEEGGGVRVIPMVFDRSRESANTSESGEVNVMLR